MASTPIELGDELGDLLAGLGPVEQTAREMIVLELYRRGLVSSGRAAILLALPRLAFIERASELGIPYFRLDRDDLDAEVSASRRL